MKKIFLIFAIIICFCFTGCKDNRSLDSVSDSEFVHYDSLHDDMPEGTKYFTMSNCYTEESIKNDKYQLAENVKVGDKIVCRVDFETMSTDAVKSFKYTLSYGSGLKLIKEEHVSNATKNDNTYLFTLDEAAVTGPGGGEFTFEVVDTTDLTYGIKDIKFMTDDNEYYYTNDDINTLNVK